MHFYLLRLPIRNPQSLPRLCVILDRACNSFEDTGSDSLLLFLNSLFVCFLLEVVSPGFSLQGVASFLVFTVSERFVLHHSIQVKTNGCMGSIGLHCGYRKIKEQPSSGENVLKGIVNSKLITSCALQTDWL
jgi:hypothetical protein